MDEDLGVKTLNSILEILTREANGNELSHIEIKENNIDPNLIGRSISAIANTCVLENKEKGFLVFGVTDNNLEIVGVTFDPFNLKYGNTNQDMEIYLRQMLLGADFRFVPIKTKTKDFLIIEISKSLARIATFQKKSYIRIGKNTSELNQYPELEKKVWSKLNREVFWKMTARQNITDEELLQLLDHEVYFQQIQLPQPKTKSAIIERFLEEGFCVFEEGCFSITNLGAILLARDMKKFPTLNYKTPRVITYAGDTKLSTVVKDKEGVKGYASGFESLRIWVDSQIQEPQEITKTFREKKSCYPEKALRELLANALIHQDFEESGMRPTIEIYKNRIDISNPGRCLVDPERILGAVPKTRNEAFVDVMKRLRICETRGSGIPRTISEIETWQLPAPTFVNHENAFKVSLYSHKSFDNLDNEEKLRICVQHVIFMYIQESFANNETLRKRFGLSEKKANTISKLVRTAKDKKLIKDFDPESSSKKYIKYVPIWA